MEEFIRLCQDGIKHNKKFRDYDSNVEKKNQNLL